MNINPHLNFNGQCKEAFEFYEKVLGGKIVFSMTWGEMPGGAADQFPPETHSRIMHTTLKVDDQTIMGADTPPATPNCIWVRVRLVATSGCVTNGLSRN